MRLTLRAKLTAVVAISGLAMLVLVVTSSVTARQAEQHIDAIQQRFLPKVGLRPRLEAQFERVRRGLQDAVAASDNEQLELARAQQTELTKQLAAAGPALDAGDAAALQRAFDEYYAAAHDVSRRLIRGETGEQIVDDMAAMQVRQTRAAELLDEATRFDQAELSAAFEAAERAQTTGAQVRLGISLACVLLVIALAVWTSRTVLRSLADLTAGIARFGQGDFATAIPITTYDEIGAVAQQANQMAQSLQRLGAERNRIDWVKTGGVGLSEALRGELDPEEAADRALAFLAHYLDAAVGALYYADAQGVLRLLGRYALSTPDGGQPEAGFRPGEGIVGQAAQQTDIAVHEAATDEHLRFRSGLAEGAPRMIVCLPLVHVGKVTGVLELAFLRTWPENGAELLLAVRDALTIAIEVARGRASTATLLGETQRQAQRLAAQEDALRLANDELRAQQAALQQSNEELAQKAHQLDAQRRALEDKNAALNDARQRLEQKAEELTTASAYKSQFLANMSHELRTPLNAIIGFAELLFEGAVPIDAPQHKEFLGDILTSGKHLLQLINDVLDLSKVEAGKLEFRPEPVLLDKLIGEVLGILRTTAATKRIHVESHVDPTLGEVVLDPARLKQVLYNYVSNALKFTPEGGHVTIRALAEAGDTLRLEVEDTGIGIEPEDMARLFIEFQQILRAGAKRQGGTGLGLALTKRLVEAQGGSVGVRSTPGKGSVFHAILPRQAAGGAVPEPASMVVLQPRPGAHAVLVVEDDPRDQSQLVQALTHAGYDVAVAATGARALELCNERRFDAITLDLLLPDVNGLEVLRQIRASDKNAHVPVIVITVVAEPGAVAGFAVQDFLSKPLDDETLLRALTRAGVPPEGTGTVLVIDDDPAALKLMAATLKQLGYQAVCEQDAQVALTGLQQAAPSAIVLDLLMPGMDGFAFLDRLRGEPAGQQVPVIIWTVKDLDAQEIKHLRESAQAIVSKGRGGTAAVVAELEAFMRGSARGPGHGG